MLFWNVKNVLLPVPNLSVATCFIISSIDAEFTKSGRKEALIGAVPVAPGATAAIVPDIICVSSSALRRSSTATPFW